MPALPNLGDMDEDAIRQLCRELHAQTDKTDDNRYDLEPKAHKLNKEITELSARVAKIKEKNMKPLKRPHFVDILFFNKYLMGK